MYIPVSHTHPQAYPPALPRISNLCFQSSESQFTFGLRLGLKRKIWAIVILVGIGCWCWCWIVVLKWLLPQLYPRTLVSKLSTRVVALSVHLHSTLSLVWIWVDPWIFYGILSVPQNIVMDLNNVMGGRWKIDYYYCRACISIILAKLALESRSKTPNYHSEPKLGWINNQPKGGQFLLLSPR